MISIITKNDSGHYSSGGRDLFLKRKIKRGDRMKMFDLGFGTIIIRFYLMMMLVIVGVLTKFWILPLLALPLFLSIMMGISFKAKPHK
ncbi:MAG: hypothetical protein KDC53_18080 [Saprospiraceae bacterium]|nr:hypothetical protein [Saprospiraceae bacterium]